MIFHLTQSYWFWSHLTTIPPFSPPMYSFHGICKKLGCSRLWPFWEDFCHNCYPYNIMKVVCLSAFLTVWSVMGSGKVFLIKWVGSTALSSLELVVWWIIGDLSPRESLEIDSFLLFPLSPLVFLSIILMVDFHRSVLDWIWCKEWPSLRREMIMKFLVDDVGFIKQRWKESMAKVMKTCWQSHKMLFIVSMFNIIVIWLDTKGILLK